MNEKEISALTEQWEEVYKKGLLSFWLMLLLSEKPMYAFEMGKAIEEISQGIISVDDRSLYRACKRFETSGIVESSWQASEVGPPRRYYQLSASGKEILRRFCQRNILIFQTPEVSQKINKLFSSSQED